MNNIFDEYDEDMSSEVSEALSNLFTVISEVNNRELVAGNDALCKKVEQLTDENKRLKEEKQTLADKNKDQEKLISLNTLALLVVNNAEMIVKSPHQIESFLDCLFVPTFENVHIYAPDTPIWISAMTRYYNKRHDVLQLIRYFNWSKTTPKNADDFILPLDWSEDKVECWLNNMSHNYVCNGKLYDWNNLEWWAPFALEDISTFYTKHRGEYSEVPFQYVFMNPYMKTEKFLIKIGENISGHHLELIDGLKILKLEDEERAIVVKAALKRFVDYGIPVSEGGDTFRRWLWDNVDVILDRDVIKNLYDKFVTEFTSIKDIIRLPSSYILQYVLKYPKKVGEFLSSDKITNQAKSFILKSLEGFYDDNPASGG